MSTIDIRVFLWVIALSGYNAAQMILIWDSHDKIVFYIIIINALLGILNLRCGRFLTNIWIKKDSVIVFDVLSKVIREWSGLFGAKLRSPWDVPSFTLDQYIHSLLFIVCYAVLFYSWKFDLMSKEGSRLSSCVTPASIIKKKWYSL